MARTSKNFSLLADNSYETWSKEDLIQRIQLLESTKPKSPAKSNPDKKGKKVFDFSKISTRFIALRFAYMGWNFNGLSFQYDPTPLPTVEEVILDAMVKAKLIESSDPSSCGFSRCGRTDKGVSALNQVIALNVRSNLDIKDQADISKDDRELPYVTILNALLPLDIRITEVCLRPPEGFDARFSCLYRHYKYVFSGEHLDVAAMKVAAKLYEGTHDYRNFCKIDGSKQITNHERLIHSADIISVNEKFYAFDLKGSAFLWHQVRCMVAILFLVGQGHEKPSIVLDLLNVEKYPSRPLYEMAHDIPLVLYDCVFPEMEWLSPATNFGELQQIKMQKECKRFNGLKLDYQLKAQIVSMMDQVFAKKLPSQKSNYVNLGDGVGRAFKNYTPLSQRPLGETVEHQNLKFLEKKKRKLEK